MAVSIPPLDLKQHVADGLPFREVERIAVRTIDENVDRELFQGDVAVHPNVGHVDARKCIEGRGSATRGPSRRRAC